MKRYIQVPEDAEYREYYDSYRVTVENLNDTDFLYKSNLSNGQVFFSAPEMYGFVNNQAAIRGRNLTITSDYIDNFVIRDFQVFSRKTNELISININCNLKNYRDNKPHYLYIVLSHNGTYEVYDNMFQSDENKIIFARFIIDNLGNSKQFYMMLPFAGSADYIKGNQFYQVTDGLRLKVVNDITKQLTLSKAKIRFSGINFDDIASPDCLEVDFEGNALPIRYCAWDSSNRIPRVDWVSDPVDKLKLDKVINYINGNMSSVPEGKFSLQKLYYDVYTKCIIAMYGNAIYNTREEAILAIDTIMTYPLPDGIEYLIPVACVIAENTEDAISEDNFRVINLDYNEQEVLDSDTFTRQQASEALTKATQAINIANEADQALTEHTGDRTNPHRVRLDQLYNSTGNPIVLADDYASYSVSSILSAAAAAAANAYYSKNGGTISGNATITGTLTVNSNSTFKNAVVLEKGITIGGNLAISSNGTYDIGSTSARIKGIYTNTLNASSDVTISGTLTSSDIIPNTNVSSNLGSSSKRYNYLYTKYINASSSITAESASISAGLSAATGTFSTSITTPKLTVSTNGYLIIGNKAFGLGGTFTPPTGVNEAYAIY